MSTKRLQLDSYRKSLLNRVTANVAFLEYVENCLAREDEGAKHSFHKIMVHNWSGTANQLFDTLSDYFSSSIIPIMYVSQGDISSFYTSSLSFIMKVIKLDFMFPYQRNMFNIDILFNDKSSLECFDRVTTVEDIVSGVISRRFNNNFELNLSNFCSDPEFAENKINFYKINLLSQFKILMLRMGRDTQSLNLSDNNLSQVPVEILNFFIKGPLIAINISNNNIPSLSEVLRVSSRIEQLWIEGNPLCDELDAVEYVKNVTMKFPRLTVLDGITINQYGLALPVIKNFLAIPDRRTKMVVEKFLTLYFSYYDSNRSKTANLYDDNAKLTFNFVNKQSDIEKPSAYVNFSRNIMDQTGRAFVMENMKIFTTRIGIMSVLCQFPNTVHDTKSFQVDVLIHDKKSLLLVVDGLFKQLSQKQNSPDLYYQFRRTFVFSITTKQNNSWYAITSEMFTLTPATTEQIKNNFKVPIRNVNDLTLIDPDIEEREAICKAFMHLSQLIRPEAEARLRLHDWDIRKAIQIFAADIKDDRIPPEKFIEEDDFSDSESLFDDEID